MFLPTIRRDDPSPIYRQILEQTVQLVDEGTLPPGTRLPPTRVLAGKLGLNRSTVMRAYAELWALGYVESRPGSYSTVRARLKPMRPDSKSAAALIDWEQASAPASRRVYQDLLRLPSRRPPAQAPELIDLATLAADRGLCPVDAFRRAVRQVLLEDGKELLDYGDPAGYPPLREVIAQRMRTHGVSVTPEEILITNGAQHGLDLALRLLTKAGAPIAVETPTYSLAIPLFRLHGLRILEVPMLPGGLDLDAFERLVARELPALLYTIPSFHNPTGITTDQVHRERLLTLAERHRVPVVEDGFEEEMKYFGQAVLPIKSMDAHGVVIYLGTFSKVVFPGLRIGWIAAHRECIRRLLAISRFSTLSGNTLAQAAVFRFCATGRYEEYLRRVHKVYRRRMQTLLRALKEHLPAAGVEWTQPPGGYTLWVRLASGSHDEHAVLERLAREGVLVPPGSLFFPSPPDRVCFRVSIAGRSELEIEEGCRRLGRALKAVVGG